MSNAREPAIMIRLNEGERGLVARLRERLDGRPLAPLVRDAVLEFARETVEDEANA
jgi:hypothetical protein